MSDIGGMCKNRRNVARGNGSGWTGYSHYPVRTFVHEMGHAFGSNHPFGIPLAGTYPGKTLAKAMGLPAPGETGGIMDYDKTMWKGKWQFGQYSRRGICRHLQRAVKFQTHPKYIGRCRKSTSGGKRSAPSMPSSRTFSLTCLSNKDDESWKGLKRFEVPRSRKEIRRAKRRNRRGQYCD